MSANKEYTQEALIKQLQELASVLERAPTGAEASASNLTASLSTYKKKFGSWKKALEAAGVVEEKIKLDFSKEGLIEHLKDLGKRLGKQPSAKECTADNYSPSVSTYIKNFGSWKKAQEAAGFTATLRAGPRIPEKELIEKLQELGFTLGKVPTAKDCECASNMFSVGTYQARFGSWNSALEAAGFDVNGNLYTDEQLLSSLERFVSENGRMPKQQELLSTSYLYGMNTYKTRFGSWEEVCRKVGQTIPQRITSKSDEELLESLATFYKQEGFAPRQEDCNSGSYPYLSAHGVYGRRFGTFTKALQLAEVPLNPRNTSRGEEELASFVAEIYDGEIVRSCRTVLSGGFEIDIYLPELNIGIEYNGEYWHSQSVAKDRYNLLTKTKRGEEAGIQIIHIFEQEWKNASGLVKGRLRSILGKNERKLFARKCTLQDVSATEAKEFLDANHLQGNCPSSLRRGLFHEKELVAIMTFGKPRFTDEAEYELLRFATKENTTVVGGASKLFKGFKEHSVISYADLRWGSGNLYYALGFSKIRQSKPNYRYIKGSSSVSRYKAQKHKLAQLLPTFDPSLSEYENMIANNYHRIYDVGNGVFLYRPD